MDKGDRVRSIGYILFSIVATRSIDQALAARNAMGVADYIVPNQFLFPTLVVATFLLLVAVDFGIDFVLGRGIHITRREKSQKRDTKTEFPLGLSVLVILGIVAYEMFRDRPRSK